MTMQLTREACLPGGRDRRHTGSVGSGGPATRPGRRWSGSTGRASAISAGSLPTTADVLNAADPAGAVRDAPGEPLGDLAAILDNSAPDARDETQPRFLAPCDLQALKASGVTFVESLLERVIEEQAHGDLARAEAIRGRVMDTIGGDLKQIRPGSDGAMRLKELLIEQGAWSQYLEVGIGPDAEIFTKAQPMSAVGIGAEIGIHRDSAWNNPEPEGGDGGRRRRPHGRRDPG